MTTEAEEISMNAELALLKSIEASGVRFTMEMPMRNVFLSADEALRLARDPDETMLELFGCTRDDVREWEACGGTVMCSATTKAGPSCQNVARYTVYPISAWLRMKDSSPRCWAHSEGSSRRKTA